MKLVGLLLVVGVVCTVAVDTDTQDKSSNKLAKQTQSTRVLHDGNTIGLQTFVRDHWLQCGDGNYVQCARDPCPRMQMTGSDWDNCKGEVFTIWRLVAPILGGDILVGDKVSLDPAAYTWLSCEGYCHTQSYGCTYIGCDLNTAVWTIYAIGKAVGEAITAGDDVSLRYDNQEWLSVGHGDAVLTSCLGQTLPPPYDAYDGCSNEHFTLWIKP